MLLFFYFAISSAQGRQVKQPIFNPDCNGSPVCSPSPPGNATQANYTMFMTESISASDKFYFIWSTIGVPSMLFLRTDVNGSVVVDWSTVLGPRTIPEIKLEQGELLGSFGYSFPAIWNCTSDDPYSKGTVSIPLELSDCHDLKRVSLEWLQWDFTNHTVQGHEDEGYYFLMRSNDPVFGSKGQLSIQITIYSGSGRSDELLHMLHTSNSTQFEVSLSDLEGKDISRFTLEHTYFSPDQRPDFKYNSHKTLDDEYTPGVFQYKEIDTRNSSDVDGLQNYFGWKQAGYSSSKLDLNGIVPLLDADEDTTRLTHQVPEQNIVTSFMTSQYGAYTAIAFNMTFGSNKNDGGYDGYFAWNGQLGLGHPDYDGMSALIIGITITGVILPVVVIIVGGVFVYFMKKRRDAFAESKKVNPTNENGHRASFSYQPIVS